MAIIWTKIIPRWAGDTIEPPEAKKDAGWLAGDKPPAKWWNWFQKGLYEAVSENREVIEDIDSQLTQKANTSDVNTALNLKANTQQENWTIATLVNGWVHTTNTPISYYKDTLGMVHIRGLAKVGVKTRLTKVFDLPNGSRPDILSQQFIVRAYIDTLATEPYATIEITSDGSVNLINLSNTNATQVSFSGISFRAGA